MRKPAVVRAEYDKLYDRVWWNRHVSMPEPANKFWQDGENVARALEDRYGKDMLPWGDEFEEDIITARFAALAWVLGANWDEAGDT